MSLILPQIVNIKITPKELNYYKSKGYDIPMKIGKTGKLVYDRYKDIQVHILDLPISSCKKVWVYCDMCGEIYQILYRRALECSHSGKHYCKHCHSGYFISGEKNPRWNPNRTKEERMELRHTPKYRKFNKIVLARDNYTCQCCGKLGEADLVVHHMNAWASYPKERFDINNGITLCKSCHGVYHGLFGSGKNTKEEFEAWLGSQLELKEFDNNYIPSLRKIFSYEENQIYKDIYEYVTIHNCTRSNVYQACKFPKKVGEHNIWTVKGNHLFWLDDYEKMTKEDLDKYFELEDYILHSGITCSHRKEYINVINGQYYFSQKQMRVKNNISNATWQNYKSKFTHIILYEDYINLSLEQQKEILIKNHHTFEDDSFLLQEYNKLIS